MYFRLLILFQFFAIFIFNSCKSSSDYSAKNDSFNDSIITSIVTIKKENIENNSKILFSTGALDTAHRFMAEEYPLEIIYQDGVHALNSDEIIKLKPIIKHKVVITISEGGDYNNYSLHVLQNNVIYPSKSLNITPYWSEPWEGGDYKKKDFEIYEDYLVHIKTEEFSEGDTTRYENYYRISDKGEFSRWKNNQPNFQAHALNHTNLWCSKVKGKSLESQPVSPQGLLSNAHKIMHSVVSFVRNIKIQINFVICR